MSQEFGRLYPSAYLQKIEGSEEFHTIQFRLTCKNEVEFKEWLIEHQNRSGVIYRVLKTTPTTGERVVYKAVFRCQHNTYPNSHSRVKIPSAKHTDCQAKLKVSIQSIPEGRKNYSKDQFRTTYPSIVEVHFTHNHQIHVADSVKYKYVSEKCKRKILGLLKTPHESVTLKNVEKKLAKRNVGAVETIQEQSSIVDNIQELVQTNGDCVEILQEQNCILVPDDKQSKTQYYWISADSNGIPRYWYRSMHKTLDMDAEFADNQAIRDDDDVNTAIMEQQTNENQFSINNSMKEEIGSNEDPDLLREMLLVLEKRLKDALQTNPYKAIPAIRRMKKQLHHFPSNSTFLTAVHHFGKLYKQTNSRATSTALPVWLMQRRNKILLHRKHILRQTLRNKIGQRASSNS